MKKHYYAFLQTVQGGNKTYGLLPINKDAVYQFGFYNPVEKVLTLLSKDSQEELEIVDKLDKYGNIEKDKSGTLKERRTLNTNLRFRLSGGDKDWFITEFVENPEICSGLEQEYIKKEEERKQEAEKAAESEKEKEHLIVVR